MIGQPRPRESLHDTGEEEHWNIFAKPTPTNEMGDWNIFEKPTDREEVVTVLYPRAFIAQPATSAIVSLSPSMPPRATAFTAPANPLRAYLAQDNVHYQEFIKMNHDSPSHILQQMSNQQTPAPSMPTSIVHLKEIMVRKIAGVVNNVSYYSIEL